jgi:hypothetical protein
MSPSVRWRLNRTLEIGHFEVELLNGTPSTTSVEVLIPTVHIQAHTFSNDVRCLRVHPSIGVCQFRLDGKMKEVGVKEVYLSKWFGTLSNFCRLNLQIISSWEVGMPKVLLRFSNVTHEVDRV